MVGDKLVSAGWAAAVVLLSSALVVAFSFWAFVANAPPSLRGALDRWYAHGAFPDVAALFVLFGLLSWRNFAVGLWTTMTGRKWPSRVVATYAAVAIAMLPVTVASFATYPGRRAAAVAFAATVLPLLVAAKITATGLVARRLVQRDIVPARTALMFAAGWCVATGSVVLLVSRFLDIGATVVCIVALLVPAARVGLAPLALDGSRHG